MKFDSKTYINFYKIEKNSFREKVRFYEQHVSEIEELFFEEKMEVKCDYGFALFEIGKYSKFLQIVDGLIEDVIIENIYEINGKNIFEELLFCKAACQFNQGRYEKAKYTVNELIKINPHHTIALKLYRKILRKSNFNWYEFNKAMAVVFILSGISVILVELLVVDPFYEQYSSHLEVFKWILFSSALLLLLYNEIWVRVRSYTLMKENLNDK